MLWSHSATKYSGGRSEVVGGRVDHQQQKTLERIWDTYKLPSPTLGPCKACLVARGLRTLPLRVRRQNSSAQGPADFLEDHPQVLKVHYPGLESFHQHESARRQMGGY